LKIEFLTNKRELRTFPNRAETPQGVARERKGETPFLKHEE
jgi:hypothetical protein